MGWSHTAAAGRTLAAIEAACTATRKGTKYTSTNVFIERGVVYFHEVEMKDQDDDGIRGEIFEFVGDTMAHEAGHFHIDGDGKVLSGPDLFKQAVRRKTGKGWMGASLA